MTELINRRPSSKSAVSASLWYDNKEITNQDALMLVLKICFDEDKANVRISYSVVHYYEKYESQIVSCLHKSSFLISQQQGSTYLNKDIVMADTIFSRETSLKPTPTFVNKDTVALASAGCIIWPPATEDILQDSYLDPNIHFNAFDHPAVIVSIDTPR